MKMSEIVDSLIVFIVASLLIFLSFLAGQEITERKYCKTRGGVYSFDYMECMKNETVK